MQIKANSKTMMEDERLACIERELALLKGKKEIKDEYSRDNYQH